MSPICCLCLASHPSPMAVLFLLQPTFYSPGLKEGESCKQPRVACTLCLIEDLLPLILLLNTLDNQRHLQAIEVDLDNY